MKFLNMHLDLSNSIITEQLVKDRSESLCIFSPDLTISYVNQHLAWLWGLPQHELAGRELFDFINLESYTALLGNIESICPENPVKDYEVKFIGTRGHICWQRWILRGIFKCGQAISFQAVIYDLTWEKQYHSNAELEQRLQAQIIQLEEIQDCLQQKIMHHQENSYPQIGERGASISGTASPLYDSQGNKVGAIESLRNVSCYQNMHTEFTRSQLNFKHLADTAPAIIYVLRGSHLLYINRSLGFITGYSDQDYKEREVWDFIHPEDRVWVKDLCLARQRGEDVPARYQARLLRADGRIMWASISTANIEFDNEPAILGVIIDITDLKEAEEKIRFLSYHDHLTGLYNRSYAEKKLKELDQAQNLPLSIIIGDVNGLKLVNDAFGHQEGDALLRTTAEILASCCRENNILARWGGDEFVILLPNCNEQQALDVCEDITLTCNNLSGVPVQVSISLGTSSKTTQDKSLEQICKEAEDRMYRNKLLESKSNRSSFIYSLEKTLWVRNHETQVHTNRLRQLVGRIAEALHLQREEIGNLTLLAALHDIGKIAIPNSILDKPDKLNQEEWDIIKKHSEIGYRIALSCPELAPIAEAILTHHERWDGSGYPLGLKEREIPLVARILTLADAYDVMLSGRSYQAALSEEEALAEIARCAGTQFDPDLSKLFICLIKGEEMKPRMRDIF